MLIYSLQENHMYRIALFSVIVIIFFSGCTCCLTETGYEPGGYVLKKKRFVQQKEEFEIQPSREEAIYIDKFTRKHLKKSDSFTAQRPELVVTSGHGTGSVRVGITDFTLSPDGKWAATCGKDNTVRMWDVKSGRELRVFDGHSDDVFTVAISPDSCYIASGGEDKTVKIWDSINGKLIHNFIVDPFGLSSVGASFQGEVLDLDFSPDGRLVAAVTDDDVPRIFDLGTGEEKYVFLDQAEEAMGLDFSSDGKLLATFSKKAGKIQIWDVTTGTEMGSILLKNVNQISFSPDGRFLAGLVQEAEGFSVRIWDAGSRTKIRDIKLIKYSDAMAFSPDSKRLAIIGKDSRSSSKIVIAEITTGKKSMTIEDGGMDLAFGPDGTRLFSWPNVWGISGGHRLQRFSGNISAVRGASLARDSGMLVSVKGSWSTPAVIDFWDLAQGGIRRRFSLPGIAKSYALGKDARSVVIGDDKGNISLFDASTGDVKWRIKGSNKGIFSLALSPDSKYIASGSFENPVRLWKFSTGKSAAVMQGHEDSQCGLTFTNDSRFLLSGCGDETAKSWEVNKINSPGFYNSKFGSGNAVEYSLSLSHDDFVQDVAQSPDGKWIATIQSGVLRGRQIKLWDRADQSLVYILIDREISWDVGLAFTPDSKRLAFVQSDGTIGLWEIGNKKELLILPANSVINISFTEDGAILLSSGEDGKIGLWDVKTGELLASLISLSATPDWIVVTPDGFFDGTPEAWKGLSWRFEGNTFNNAPLEIFFNEFYYPRLLTDILAGRRPKANVNIADKDRRQPTVKLKASVPKPGVQVKARTITVEIEVTEAPADKKHRKGAGARDLRLFRNGSLVKAWQGNILKGKKRVKLKTRLTIVAGENRLTAYAFNNDNIKSTDASLTITGAGSLKRPGTLYVLAVGLNEYANPSYNLRFAQPDAEAFGRELKRRQEKVGKYEKVKVIELMNNEATKKNILAALKRFAKGESVRLKGSVPPAIMQIDKVQPEDAVVIYFAGHGTAQKDRFYLLPHDLGYTGAMEKLNTRSLKGLLSHSISDLELEKAFRGIDAHRMLLVIDACNSGQALEAREKRRGPMNSKGLAQLAYEKGMNILTAAQAYQVAMEDSQLGHGFMTYALVEEGLKTTSADSQPADGEVWLREWLDYSVARVPEIHQELIGFMNSTRGLKVIKNKKKLKKAKQWDVQRPRVFYRRQAEVEPMVIRK